MRKSICFLGFSCEATENLSKLIDAMYGSKYNLMWLSSEIDLNKIDTQTKSAIVLYIEELSIEQRKFIWQFKSNYPLANIIFCSRDMSVANFSWQSQAIFFLPYPFSRRSLALMFQKIEEKYVSPKLRLKLSYQGGFEIVNSEDVCFCVGDGNYTTVHLTNSKTVLLSKKIKDVFQKFSPFPEIVRIGKSYIVNLDNIVKIDDMKVYFRTKQANVSFVLSPVYLKRLKEYVLWYTN